MATRNGDMQRPKHNEQLSTEQLLDAQAHIWSHTFSFINSMSLKCAVQLGIPDIIHNHGRPMFLSQLIEALPIDKAKSQCIHRLMRLLVHSKFFVKHPKSDDQEEDCYWLAPASRLLLKDTQLTSVPRVLFILDPICIEPWQHMSEWLVNGHNVGSAFEMAHGKTSWECMGHDSRLSNLFNETMACDGRLVLPILLKECKMFEEVETVVDVGGGIGTTAKAILDAFPRKKCIVLDLPHVVAGLEGTNNLTFVGGNMFQSIPQGDVVLLKWILHDWKDEDCVKILKKCREAMRSKAGKVMIIEMVLDENGKAQTGEEEGNKVIEAQLLFDMAMMTYVNGKERSEKQWAKVFTDAGFSRYKVSHVLGVRSIIEVYP